MPRCSTLLSNHNQGHYGQRSAAWTFLRKIPIILWLFLLDNSLTTVRGQTRIPLET